MCGFRMCAYVLGVGVSRVWWGFKYADKRVSNSFICGMRACRNRDASVTEVICYMISCVKRGFCENEGVSQGGL